MNTVWKFPLRLVERQAILMPEGAKPIHIGEQLGILTMWAQVDPAAESESRSFDVIGTGHYTIQPNTRYIGTSVGDHYVWHVYEVQP